MSNTTTTIPKSVRIDLMFRDAANYKTCESYTLSNEKNFSEQTINDALDALVKMESFVPSYYGITNHPAPLGNEFIPSNTDDHCFVELCDWEFKDKSVEGLHYNVDDVSTIVVAVADPEIVEKRRREAKAEAISSLTTLINSINDLEV